MQSPSFKVRRRFAKAGFAALLITLFSCLLIVVFGDAATAKNLHEAGIIIAPIVVCLTANISHYMKLVADADSSQV
jgi:hypothetical protein